MLKIYKESGGRYFIEYFRRKYTFQILECNKKYGELEQELNYRKIKSEHPIALVPASLIKTFLQYIYAVLSYIIYSTEFKVKNQGLLIIMLITGVDQISSIIPVLRREYEKSVSYYLLIIGDKKYEINCSECKPYDYEDNILSKVEIIVKNMDKLIKRV